jgi:hypothetical protein
MASRPSLSLSRKSPLKSKKATNSSGGGGSGGGSKKATTAAAVATNARVSMRLILGFGTKPRMRV